MAWREGSRCGVSALTALPPAGSLPVFRCPVAQTSSLQALIRCHCPVGQARSEDSPKYGALFTMGNLKPLSASAGYSQNETGKGSLRVTCNSLKSKGYINEPSKCAGPGERWDRKTRLLAHSFCGSGVWARFCWVFFFRVARKAAVKVLAWAVVSSAGSMREESATWLLATFGSSGLLD